MARVQYGGGVTSFVGSIKGNTFQNNSSGTIVRGRPSIRRKATILQTTTHSLHIAMLAGWQALTPSQKSSWNDYALAWPKINKLGQTKQLTGQNWYESVNIKLIQIGASPVSVPATHTLPASPPAFTIDITDDDFIIHTDEGFNWTENAVNVWATLPTRKITLNVNQIRKLIQTQTTDPSGAITITAGWETATGLPWNPSNRFPGTNIVVCLESICKASGISSAFLCTLADVPADGWLLTPDGQPIEDTDGNQLTKP